MKTKHVILILAGVLALAGCGRPSTQLPVSGESMEPVSATIFNAKGKKIGKVQLEEMVEGVKISLQADGLSPGVHGIHFHETGVCTSPDFESAGAHFNPTGKQHGFENPKGFHSGDLPNIDVPEGGKVVTQITTKEVTLKQGEPNSLLDADGSALVIHAEADDYKTDPAGNSGARIACAAIGK
ncbi:superoxide dismutase family protein [Sporosarcina sp. 179-K 3D1 HS]|uniref:superoxide dismutase family protein n=1 Tax=Sporosarcina sp. 179-K 3D1 HS TaxID=3232169 RepID=UPI0039A39CF2